MDDFLQCARIAFRRQHGLAPDPAARTYDPPDPDERFFRKASRHRLVGLFAVEWFPEWKSRAYGQAQYTANCTATAESVFKQLRAAIPSVGLIKGPALAVQAWPQPGLRNYDDLDFHCAFVRYEQLRDALAALGYEPGIPQDARNAQLWHFGWGVAFAHPQGPRIECNHRLFPPHFPWPSRLNREVQSRWQMQQLDHVAVRAPSPDVHLLYCCMHALWHGWDRLAWLVDIAGLLVRHPESLAQARTLAGRHGFLRQALKAGCELADALFGPLPGVRDADQGSMPRQQALFCCDPRRHSLSDIRKEHMRHMNRTERLRYTLRRMCTPGDPDFQYWCLPAGLHGMYWFLRPFRIAVCPSRIKHGPA